MAETVAPRRPPTFEVPELLTQTCALLDAASIALLCQTCRFVPEHIRNPRTVAFVASMRGGALERMTSLERVALAEALVEMRTAIQFEFRSVELVAAAGEPLDRFAALLRRHASFQVSIEAHCGLEAPRSLGYGFSRDRARSVARALVRRGVAATRLSVVSWSNARPLVWAFGEPDGSANRRVEMYVRSENGFEVPPRPTSHAHPPPGLGFELPAGDPAFPGLGGPVQADQDARALDGIDDESDDEDPRMDDAFLEAMLNSDHVGIMRLREAGIDDVDSLRQLIEQDRPTLLRLLFGQEMETDSDSEGGGGDNMESESD